MTQHQQCQSTEGRFRALIWLVRTAHSLLLLDAKGHVIV